MWYLLILRESGTNEAAVKFNPGIILYDEADVLLCEYSAAKEEMLTVLLGDHTQRLVWEAWFHLPPPFLSSGCLSLFFFLSSLPSTCLHLHIPSAPMLPVSIFPSVSMSGQYVSRLIIFVFFPVLLYQWFSILLVSPIFHRAPSSLSLHFPLPLSLLLS